MAQIDFEQFKKMESSNNQSNSSNDRRSPLVSYLSLANDGDTAIVRFNISGQQDLKIYSKHQVVINGKRRNIQCLRGYNEPASACPLCEHGLKPSYRMYVELIKYDMNGNNMEITPALWDQPARFAETLKSFILDYGDLRDIVFKITRHGEKGNTGTTYSVIPANPKIYNEENYVKDFSAFDTYDINRYVLLNKSKEELEYFVENNSFPETPTRTQSDSHTASQPVADTTAVRSNNVSTPSFTNETRTDTYVRSRVREVSQPNYYGYSEADKIEDPFPDEPEAKEEPAVKKSSGPLRRYQY